MTPVEKTAIPRINDEKIPTKNPGYTLRKCYYLRIDLE